MKGYFVVLQVTSCEKEGRAMCFKNINITQMKGYFVVLQVASCEKEGRATCFKNISITQTFIIFNINYK